MSTPKLVNDGTISCAEFHLRLTYALENYVEYCRLIKINEKSFPPVEWLDHFQTFLDLSELERRK